MIKQIRFSETLLTQNRMSGNSIAAWPTGTVSTGRRALTGPM